MQEADGGPKPALRIVSLHADLTDRGPTFDMDLSELERDGQPISYDEARQYFKRDPAHRSARLGRRKRGLSTGGPPCQHADGLPEPGAASSATMVLHKIRTPADLCSPCSEVWCAVVVCHPT